MQFIFKNYYELFGIPGGIEDEELQQIIDLKYRKIISIYHPDHFSDKNEKVRFEEISKYINNAKDTLKNPEERKKYNQTLKKSKLKNDPDNKNFETNEDLNYNLKDYVEWNWNMPFINATKDIGSKKTFRINVVKAIWIINHITVIKKFVEKYGG